MDDGGGHGPPASSARFGLTSERSSATGFALLNEKTTYLAASMGGLLTVIKKWRGSGSCTSKLTGLSNPRLSNSCSTSPSNQRSNLDFCPFQGPSTFMKR